MFFAIGLILGLVLGVPVGAAIIGYRHGKEEDDTLEREWEEQLELAGALAKQLKAEASNPYPAKNEGILFYLNTNNMTEH